jgi:hypothetical protein
MDSPLGTAFSRVDALKRQLYDMLTNPRDAAAMLGGRIVESGQQAQALQEQTFGDPNRPFRVTDPQAMARLTDMLMQGPMGFAPAGITAYHGSPYLFRQFDPSKVGTGEGVQVYGVGAGYTAEARPVAEEYARNLTTQKLARDIDTDPAVRSGINLMQTAGSGGLENLESMLQTAYGYKPQQAKETVEKVKKSIGGYLYKGDIPDEILPKFLDWNKKFEDQSPDVKEAVKKYWKENKVYGDPTKYTGEGIYDSVVAHLFGDAGRQGAQKAASDALESFGIRGIRYLDQGSRAEGKGTSNFVPFRPEDFKVEEINDQPLQEWINKGLL